MLFSECAVAATDGAGAPPKYQIETKSGRRVEAVATVTVHCPDFSAEKWKVLATVAPELPSQRDVSTKLSPSSISAKESSPYERPILWFENEVKNHAEKTRFRYDVTYRATLQERKLVPVPEGSEAPTVEPLSPEEEELYLAPTEFYDFKDAGFQSWLKTHGLDTRGGQGDVDFARKVLLVIYDTLKYQGTQVSDRASVVCRDGKSHCGGLSSVFVSAMRANGIPARWLLGNWAGSASPPQNPHHVMAEFYAEGVGWVPVDAAAAIGHFPDNREVMLERCFGTDGGNFITTQVDHGLEFDPGNGEKMVMAWPYGASPSGSGDLAKWDTHFDWKVKDLAAAE